MIRLPSSPTLFPYTTLFRSSSLPMALPGQFLVLKLNVAPPKPPLLRNYSMSGTPGAKVYRVSVKREVKGIASSFVHNQKDRKSTRLNSSHLGISYAVFCLKK